VEDLFKLAQEILDNCPQIDVEVNVVDDDRGIVVPDVGSPSPIEVYEASVIEQSVSTETGVGLRPLERHPDGHLQARMMVGTQT
jgi:hypothetical protein